MALAAYLTPRILSVVEPNPDASFAGVALKFARSLVALDFSSAHEILSPELRAALGPGELRRNFEEMVDYGEGPPIEATLIRTMERWPDRRARDLGWAYVAIVGEGFSEAITAVVEERDCGNVCIRHLEWGRP